MTTVYEALTNVARKAQKSFAPVMQNESDDDHLRRLTEAVSGSTKDEFDAMPMEAQSWFDQAAAALNEGHDVPLPEGFSREQPAAEPEPARPIMARPGMPQPAAAPEQPATAPQSTRRQNRQSRRRAAANAADNNTSQNTSQPATTALRRAVIADQSLTVNGLIEKLKAENIADMTERRSTVSTIRYDTMVTLRIAREMGWQPPQ